MNALLQCHNNHHANTNCICCISQKVYLFICIFVDEDYDDFPIEIHFIILFIGVI